MEKLKLSLPTEISRAMRNRGVEVYVENFDSPSASDVLNHLRQLSALGLPGLSIAKIYTEGISNGSMSLVHIKLLLEGVRRGESVVEALAKMDVKADYTDFSPPKIATPSSWPDQFSGKRQIQHSGLATSFLDGSLLFHLITDSEHVFMSDLQFENLPSKSQLVLASIELYLRRCTPSGFQERKAWLKFLNEASEGTPFQDLIGFYGTFFETDRVDLTEKIMEARHKYLSECNLSFLSDALVFNPRTTANRFKGILADLATVGNFRCYF